MDIFLIIIAAFLMILGVVGSFLPVLPGPLTGWLGLLVLYLMPEIDVSLMTLVITLIVAILIWILDYIIPALGTKKFGGTKAGMIGTSVGFIMGAFVGAFAGELINKADSKTALKAAFGSLLGFLTSAFIKFVVAIIYLGLFISIIWDHRSIVF